MTAAIRAAWWLNVRAFVDEHTYRQLRYRGAHRAGKHRRGPR